MSLFFEELEAQELRDRVITLLRTGNYSICGMAKKINVHNVTLKRFVDGKGLGLQNLIKVKNWLETEETK